MKCPACKIDNDCVRDVRTTAEGWSRRRRRECLSCAFKYTTYEHAYTKSPIPKGRRWGRAPDRPGLAIQDWQVQHLAELLDAVMLRWDALRDPQSGPRVSLRRRNFNATMQRSAALSYHGYLPELAVHQALLDASPEEAAAARERFKGWKKVVS